MLPSLLCSGAVTTSPWPNCVSKMQRGEVHTLIMHGVNPAYDYPDAEQFLAGLEKVALSISFSDRRDETSSHAHAVCPDHHFLEAWGDAEPVESHFSLAQPLIAPLFETRAAQDTLLTVAGRRRADYYNICANSGAPPFSRARKSCTTLMHSGSARSRTVLLLCLLGPPRSCRSSGGTGRPRWTKFSRKQENPATLETGSFGTALL